MDSTGDAGTSPPSRHRPWWLLASVGVVVFALGVGVGWWSGRHDPPPPAPLEIDLPAGRYLSIGDSYSAGEGLDPWEEGTQDAPAGNRCHRSAVWAYSRLLIFTNETTPVFRACSGAVIANVFETPQVQPGAPPGQEVQVTSEVEKGPTVRLVTLTMSGNDVGFSKVLSFCFKERQCPELPFTDREGRRFDSLRAWAEVRLPKIGDELTSLYHRLRASFPEARILALGYPYLFPVQAPPLKEDPGWICHVLFKEWDGLERTAIREWGSRLNLVIARAAHDANERIEFVDLAPYFAGHEPCGSNGPWVRAVGISSGPVREGSFHPRRIGQAMMARIISCHLYVYETAAEAAAADDESRFAMAGCVAGQSIGLTEMPASGTAPESPG